MIPSFQASKAMALGIARIFKIAFFFFDNNGNYKTWGILTYLGGSLLVISPSSFPEE